MRNKGIVIELTALLDVILIMLFWVMMSMEKNNEKVRTDAAEQIAEYEQKYLDSQDELADVRKESEIIKEQFNHLLEATSDSVAAANQKALDEFANGIVLILKVRYQDNDPVMYVYSGNTEIAHTPLLAQADAAELIYTGIEELGLKETDTIICLFEYDGSVTTRYNTNYIESGVEMVRKKYKRLFYTAASISR